MADDKWWPKVCGMSGHVLKSSRAAVCCWLPGLAHESEAELYVYAGRSVLFQPGIAQKSTAELAQPRSQMRKAKLV